jgi:hypothetical protein
MAATLAACGRAPDLPPDDAATYQMLTGGDGQQFLRQISSHDWDDGGKAAAARLSWIAQDARSADEAAAQRAGEAAHAIAWFLADSKNELLRLSAGWFGLKHRPLGELNPELVGGYASALTPFQGALVGDVKSVRGFTIIGDGADVSSARSVFAVIDTNTQASNEFNDAAYQRVRDYLHTYAQAVANRKADELVALRHAAELAGVVDGGQRQSGNGATKARTAQYWINWAGYEVAAAMGARPGGPDIPGQYFTPDGRLKSPDQVSTNDLPMFANALDIFIFNHGLQGLGSDLRRWYEDAAGK